MGLFSTNNRQDAINDAKVPPSKRTHEQQANVERNRGDQAVRNADHEAKRQESYNW